MKHYRIFLILLCLTMLFPTLVYASSDTYPVFDSTKEHIVLTPSEVQCVYMKEDPYAGHVGATANHLVLLEKGGRALDIFRDDLSNYYPKAFDLDSTLHGLPTFNEQIAKYDDAFFEHNVLLIWMRETRSIIKGETVLDPTPPALRGIYLQDGVVFLNDIQPIPPTAEEPFEKQQGEYWTFISIDAEMFGHAEYNDITSFISQPENPNTSDPTLPTALILALPSAAGVMVLGKKRRGVE